MLVGLVLSVVLAAPPSAYVVLSKRSGVASPRALEVAAAVQKRLAAGEVPVGEIEDATSCKGKKLCLLQLGRRKQAVSLVLVEVGAVMNDAVARVEAIVVEEDGRSLGVVKHEGPLGTLADDLATKASAALLGPLRALHGVTPAPALVEPPMVKVEPPPPTPPLSEPQVAEAVPEKPSPVAAVAPAPYTLEVTPTFAGWFTPPRIVAVSLGAAGLATLVGALVEGLRSGGYSRLRDSSCGGAVPCVNRLGVAYANASSQTGQTAVILAIVGGGLAVAAATVFGIDAAGKPVNTTVSLVPIPGGAMVGFGFSSN